MEQTIKIKTTALLVMDVQDAAVKMLKDNGHFINSITKAIKTARKQ